MTRPIRSSVGDVVSVKARLLLLEMPRVKSNALTHRHFDGRAGEDDDGLGARHREAARQCRRDGEMGERRGGGRVEQGDEAEEDPLHEGAMRARDQVPVSVQGVQRLSAREVALSVQGVQRLSARSFTL